MNRRTLGTLAVFAGLTAGVGGVVGASAPPPSSAPPSGSMAAASVPGWSVPTDPAVAEAAVRELVGAAWAGWTAALAGVDDPEVRSGLAEWFDPAGPAMASVTESLDAVQGSEVRLRPHPTVGSSATVELLRFADPASLDAADVTLCAVGAFEEHPVPSSSVPSSDPVASSVPVAAAAERVVASRQTWRVVATADGYRVSEVAEVGQWPDATTCPPPETTTTLDPVAAEEAAATEAALDALRVEFDALVARGTPESMAEVERFVLVGSEEWDSLQASIQTLLDEGWWVRANSSVPESIVVEGSEYLGDDPPEAVVTLCVVDSGVVYLPPASPDGVEILINDTISTVRFDLFMVKADGTWKLIFISEVQEWPGSVECPPRG